MSEKKEGKCNTYFDLKIYKMCDNRKILCFSILKFQNLSIKFPILSKSYIRLHTYASDAGNFIFCVFILMIFTLLFVFSLPFL